jgi:hypothetical protein
LATASRLGAAPSTTSAARWGILLRIAVGNIGQQKSEGYQQ